MKQYKNELDQETSTTNTLKATPQYQLLQNQNNKIIDSLNSYSIPKTKKVSNFEILYRTPLRFIQFHPKRAKYKNKRLIQLYDIIISQKAKQVETRRGFKRRVIIYL